MKFLIVGLGSMGKRRIRNLHALGFDSITGFDLRNDRRLEAEGKYGIKTIDDLSKIDLRKLTAMFISVPPDKHMLYANIASDAGVHCFIEASVVKDGIAELIEKTKNSSLKIYASSTFRFHPTVKKIKQLIDEGCLGTISNFSYHSGQYLPDWHPWESIKDFYVSKRETSGCREIVPFELSWLSWILGDVKRITGFNEKTIDLDVDIDDVYAFAVHFQNGAVGTMLIDVVSRQHIRHLVLNGEKGQLIWNWQDKFLKFYDAKESSFVHYYEPEGAAAIGYSKLIIEEMYIEEIRAFIESIENDSEVVQTLESDLRILDCLYAIEDSNANNKIVLLGDSV